MQNGDTPRLPPSLLYVISGPPHPHFFLQFKWGVGERSKGATRPFMVGFPWLCAEAGRCRRAAVLVRHVQDQGLTPSPRALPAVPCLPLPACRSLPAAPCLPFPACRSLPAVPCLPLPACRSLPAAPCLLACLPFPADCCAPADIKRGAGDTPQENPAACLPLLAGLCSRATYRTGPQARPLKGTNAKTQPAARTIARPVRVKP